MFKFCKEAKNISWDRRVQKIGFLTEVSVIMQHGEKNQVWGVQCFGSWMSNESRKKRSKPGWRQRHLIHPRSPGSVAKLMSPRAAASSDALESFGSTPRPAPERRGGGIPWRA